jgi:hypothetical protein
MPFLQLSEVLRCDGTHVRGMAGGRSGIERRRNRHIIEELRALIMSGRVHGSGGPCCHRNKHTSDIHIITDIFSYLERNISRLDVA